MISHGPKTAVLHAVFVSPSHQWPSHIAKFLEELSHHFFTGAGWQARHIQIAIGGAIAQQARHTGQHGDGTMATRRQRWMLM